MKESVYQMRCRSRSVYKIGVWFRRMYKPGGVELGYIWVYMQLSHDC